MKIQTPPPERELIKHRVEIDQFTAVELSIPKILTAMELKGLMMKASQLFKMSEVTMDETPRKYAHTGRIDWTEEMKEIIRNGWGEVPTREMLPQIQQMNPKVTLTHMYAIKQRMQNAGEMTKKKIVTAPSVIAPEKRSHKTVWTPELTHIMRSNPTKSSAEIAAMINATNKKLHITAKKVADRRFYEKKYGVKV